MHIYSIFISFYLPASLEIDWVNTRRLLAEIDNYSPISWPMSILQDLLVLYETFGAFLKNSLRARALAFVLEYIEAEGTL